MEGAREWEGRERVRSFVRASVWAEMGAQEWALAAAVAAYGVGSGCGGVRREWSMCEHRRTRVGAGGGSGGSQSAGLAWDVRACSRSCALDISVCTVSGAMFSYCYTVYRCIVFNGWNVCSGCVVRAWSVCVCVCRTWS